MVTKMAAASTLEESIQKLVDQRQKLMDEVEEIDTQLKGSLSVISKIVKPENGVSASTGKGIERVRALRDGKATGTSRIVEMLREHGGVMSRPNLLQECRAAKPEISSPESALYSLQQRDVITMGRGYPIKLVK